MANFSAKCSIMTQEMVDSFCESFYILAEVHPTAPERGKTISEFPAGKDLAPHLTTRQEQAVKLLKSHKAPFRRYPECFLCLVEMGLFDFIKTADSRKVQAVEVQKGADQVKLLKSTEHCFMPLVPRAPEGSSSDAGADVSTPVEERMEDVAVDDAYLELVDPGEDPVVAKHGDEGVVMEQPKKIKKKRLVSLNLLSRTRKLGHSTMELRSLIS
ncbi:hypothetical protein Tco_0128354 [Tanacetum coccineum]